MAQFCRVFSVVCLTLVLFIFTPCVIWSNIDSLNEVRQVSRYAHIHPDPFHHVSARFLRVHGHVRLLCLLSLFNLPGL
ncbi:hypothetical protein H4582DRAFT_2027311 [Lactarius indigo]|nr:hypothetical protein H4582DRAFT_2027311 [Lactarius indigo]